MEGKSLCYRVPYLGGIDCEARAEEEAWRQISKQICELLKNERHAACRVRVAQHGPDYSHSWILPEHREFTLVVDVLPIAITEATRYIELADYNEVGVCALPERAKAAIVAIPAGQVTELPCRIFTLDNE